MILNLNSTNIELIIERVKSKSVINQGYKYTLYLSKNTTYQIYYDILQKHHDNIRTITRICNYLNVNNLSLIHNKNIKLINDCMFFKNKKDAQCIKDKIESLIIMNQFLE